MVVVITVVYNKAEMTIECINSILKSDFDDYKIIIVDNSSLPEEYDLLEKAFAENSQVIIHRNERNTGYVGGVNQGLKMAKELGSDYFLIMNNDTILDKNAISILVNVQKRHNNKAIVSGKVYYYNQPNVLQHTGMIFTDHRYMKGYYPGQNEEDKGQYEDEVERDSLDDVFWMLPSGFIEEVGYYSDNFFLYAEQGDLAQRARRKGYKLIFTPKAKIWHKVSMSSGGNPTALHVCYWRGKGMFIFHYRNLKRIYFYIQTIKNFFKYLVKSVLLKGENRKCMQARLRGYLAGIKWMINKKPDTGFNPYL